MSAPVYKVSPHPATPDPAAPDPAGPGTDLAPGPVTGEIVTAHRGGARRLDLDTYLAAHRPADPHDAARLAALAAAAGRYAESAQAAATTRKYDTGWAEFQAFCRQFGLDAGPPADVEVVALYLAQMALEGLAVSTQDGRLAAIRDRHLDAGYRSPTSDDRFKRIRDGVRRTHGVRADGKAPISLPLLAAMLTARTPGPRPADTASATDRLTWLGALRDRCLLTLGFFAATRRSELTALTVDHLQLDEQGLRVLIARSKRDQEGAGRIVDIPYAPPDLAWFCPVRHTLTWLDATGRRPHLHRPGQPRPGTVPLLSGLTRGAAVRTTALTDRAVADIVKAAATAAGQPTEIVANLAGHSLRAGFATAADAAHVPEQITARVLGHTGTTTSHYIRHTFDGTAHRAIYHSARSIDTGT
ncbi:hypothetical protein [Actinoplanes subglobosus]|uniref:Tyr recombinase domain-containing protein n=1 Tax=Actinoplanes subglobosus TaxID=1547892 RepID=A0ABV8IYE4_9ACTN